MNAFFEQNAAILGAIVLQSIALIVWLTRLGDRVAELEKHGSAPVANLSIQLARLADRMVLVEARQNIVIEQLGKNADRLDQILDRITDGHFKAPQHHPP